MVTAGSLDVGLVSVVCDVSASTHCDVDGVVCR